MPRYRFGAFSLSTRTRLLIRDGQQLALIPRYFDLLAFLIERRRDAVHRREIFERVWSDVIVSDSALSQAIRTLRRTLADDPRDPRFIRTVSRHGYQFTCPDVIEEPDDDVPEPVPVRAPDVEREQTRQKVGASVAAIQSAASWACAGSALAGAAAGLVGGFALTASPGSTAPPAVIPVLVLLGAGAGAVGGLGVGAGIAIADSSSRLRSASGLMLGAAAGGAAIGLTVEWLTRWGLAALVGVNVPIGGALEGLVIGATVGAGYAMARRAGPGVRRRVTPAAIVAVSGAAAALLLTWAGRPLVGGTLHLISREARGSQLSLEPLGRLIGEPGFGPVSRAVSAASEGGIFGFGVGAALLRGRRYADLANPPSVARDVPSA